MGVTGDFSKLSKLIQDMKGLDPSDPKVARQTALRFAPALSGFIAQEFASGTDPFGTPWKPLKTVTLAKGRTPPPLTATGAARSSLLVVAAGTSDKGSLPGYLKYHLQSRPVLPLRGEQWPPTWQEAIRRYAEQSIRELMGGKG